MGRLGTNPNRSSDSLEAKMLPDVDDAPEQETGGTVDVVGDGLHKIYMNRGQLDVYNFGARSTKIRAGRGWGKTSYIGIHMVKCVLGLRRQMGGFVGASAKQLYTRTMPNALKVVNTLGFEQFYFLGQAPAKLRWEMPLARPRNWENLVHFSNGFVWQMLSMCVRGSANGLNLAAIIGDETKYLPWQRVKEEVLPTLRGDFMPPSARKTEVKRYGYGTDPKINNMYLSQLWVSDAGLTQQQCLWEDEAKYETHDINAQIAEMLAELKYLAKHNPKRAVELSRNDTFLKRLHLLRYQSECFFNCASIENASMLGGEAWIRMMKRELPDLMFRIQILGQMKGAARDGFYSNFDIDIHGYMPDTLSGNDHGTYDVIADKFTVKRKGEALDVQHWPTKYETETLDFDAVQTAADNCSLDVDLDWHSPLHISIDANANLNCLVCCQTRTIGGRESLIVLRSFFTMNERKLRSLCADFAHYYAPWRRRNGARADLFFHYTTTVKQGGATAYAVENTEDLRFDRVVVNELTGYGFKVTPVESVPWRQERKYQFINDALAFKASPALLINREAGYNDYLITAIENAGLVPGTFRKDKSREKLKSEDGVGGDPRERTDITDALDDVWMSISVNGTTGIPKVGGGLRGRFSNLSRLPV